MVLTFSFTVYTPAPELEKQIDNYQLQTLIPDKHELQAFNVDPTLRMLGSYKIDQPSNN